MKHNLIKNPNSKVWVFAVALVLVVSASAFDQVHRINSLTMQFGTDSFATANRFGGAFGSVGQSQIQSGISNRVADAAISILMVFSDLDDLAGVSDPSVHIGIVGSVPMNLSRNPATYSGQSDLDWWYAAEFTQTNATGFPKQQLSGSLTANVLSAGPGDFIFDVSPLTGQGPMAMSSVVLRATPGNPTIPVQSTNGFPPGHVLSESVPAELTSFSVMTNGQLKGNISAESLAQTPIPPDWQGSQFSPAYSADNTMLDAMIGGLRAFGFVTVISPTQPDQVDPNAPAAGAGDPYRFTVNPTTHKVTGCLDGLMAVVPLEAGLKAAAYSAYFKFTTDRVIWIRPPAQAPRLMISHPMANQFHLVFTNTPDFPFTVLMTTDLSQKMSDWTVLGSPTQSTTGIYEFTDINAANKAESVYGVRSP